MGAFDDVLSITKVFSKSESGKSLSFDYSEYSKSEDGYSNYFEGHKRGHKGHDKGHDKGSDCGK